MIKSSCHEVIRKKLFLTSWIFPIHKFDEGLQFSSIYAIKCRASNKPSHDKEGLNQFISFKIESNIYDLIQDYIYIIYVYQTLKYGGPDYNRAHQLFLFGTMMWFYWGMSKSICDIAYCFCRFSFKYVFEDLSIIDLHELSSSNVMQHTFFQFSSAGRIDLPAL